MVSSWRCGVSLPAGHATEGLSKARTTQRMASEFWMNCITRVFSAGSAPMSKPGMSVNVRLACVTFFGLKMSASSSTRASWTSAVPVTPSLRLVAGSSCMPVSSEKIIVFPQADKPNTPIIIEQVLAFSSLSRPAGFQNGPGIATSVSIVLRELTQLPKQFHTCARITDCLPDSVQSRAEATRDRV
jgi:hypothetical protein